MAEIGTAQTEAQPINGDVPLIRQLFAAMPAVARFTVKGCIGRLPHCRVQLRGPDGLCTGARQHIGAEALQLAAVAAVEKGIV